MIREVMYFYNIIATKCTFEKDVSIGDHDAPLSLDVSLYRSFQIKFCLQGRYHQPKIK